MSSSDNHINNYEDIIDHPHHVSGSRPRMPMTERAAMFSPFAALTGYGDVLRETARLTDQKPELSEEEKMMLDYKLRLACDFPGDKPELLLTYFVPDRKKSGGACHRILGRIKRIDTYENQIVLEGGTRIDIDCILDIEGEAFTEKD